MILNAQNDLEFNCQPSISHSYCILIFFQILWSIIRIVLTKVLLNWNTMMHQLLKYRGVNPILIHTPITTSTWLCLETFHHWIRNLGSPTTKHSELLASQRGDLKSEGHLCPYSSWATLNSRVLHRWATGSMMIYSYISSVYHTSVSIYLS